MKNQQAARGDKIGDRISISEFPKNEEKDIVSPFLGDTRMKRRDFMKAGLGAVAGTQALSMASGFRASPRSPFQPPSKDTDVVVKVLGTAQDAGIPHIGCYCPNCQRARKEPALARLKPSI